MCAYYVERDSYKRNIWEIVGLREKIIGTIFIENFKIYNFALFTFSIKLTVFEKNPKNLKFLPWAPNNSLSSHGIDGDF